MRLRTKAPSLLLLPKGPAMGGDPGVSCGGVVHTLIYLSKLSTLEVLGKTAKEISERGK